MKNNILYTTHCPICRMVTGSLIGHGIPFEECEDTEEMRRLGFTRVPVFYCAMLDKYMTAQETLAWLSEQ